MAFRDRIAALIASDEDVSASRSAHPETHSPSGAGSYSVSGGVDRDDPPIDAYSKYRTQYRMFPLVRASIDRRAAETVRPGYRIEAKEDDTREALEDWLDHAGIYAGETGQPFLPVLWQIARDFDLDGEVPIEHVYDDPTEEDPDKRRIVGLKVFDPATVQFLNYPGSSRLIRPDDDDHAPKDTPKTKRGEYACLVQYPGEAGPFNFNHNEVYKSLNDITRIPRNPGFDPGETISESITQAEDVGNIRGISLVEAVSEEVDRLRARLQDYNASIANIAYPRLKVEFDDYVRGKETMDPEIVAWTDEDMKAYMGLLERPDEEKDYTPISDWEDPGGMFGSPPGVDTELVEGKVPDISDSITTSINIILGGLGVPKYMVGFGEDLNRRISEEQETVFAQDIQSNRRQISRKITSILELKAEEFKRRDDSEVTNTEGVRFQIATEGAEDPMSDEDFDAEKFDKLMKGLASYVQSGLDSLIPPEVFVEKFLHMDADELELETMIDAIDAADSESLAGRGRNTSDSESESDSNSDSTTSPSPSPSPSPSSSSDSAAAEGEAILGSRETGRGSPEIPTDAAHMADVYPERGGRQDDESALEADERVAADAHGATNGGERVPEKSLVDQLLERGVAPEDIPGFGVASDSPFAPHGSRETLDADIDDEDLVDLGASTDGGRDIE